MNETGHSRHDLGYKTVMYYILTPALTPTIEMIASYDVTALYAPSQTQMHVGWILIFDLKS